VQELVFHLLDAILPVLICVLVGLALARLEQPFDHKMVGRLVANIGYPTLVLAHLSEQHVALGAFLEMTLAAAAAVACFGVIGLGFLAALGLPIRAFLSPLMLNNVGNIGLPMSMFAFGNQGLAYAVAFLVVVVVGLFTVGIWLPQGKVSLHDIARTPVIYAVAIAIVLMATETRLPTPVDDAFTILGGLAIPLMLLTLGHTLATLRTGALWRGAYLALLHLAMAAVVAFALVHLFGLEGTARGVFILQCMMPVGVAPYLYVEMYQNEHALEVAGLILISTLLAMIVLPLVLTFWI
jgi:malate permease and related proteins